MKMSDLTAILCGWSPPHQKKPDSPEKQLLDAILDAGFKAPEDDIELDGAMHRFNSGTKGKSGYDKSGWYIAYADGVPAGRFGCWRSGIDMVWRADIGRNLTPAEEMANTRRISEARAIRDAALEKQHEVVSATVEKIWTDCTGALPDHPYLVRKKVCAHGARVTGDGRLVVPLYDKDGTLSSLQYIDHTGGKLYHAGGQVGGKFWVIGTTDDAGPIYIAEGFATSATIHEITRRPVVVAYSASNLVSVAGVMRDQHGQHQDIIIVADNDESGVGFRYAEQSSAKYGARVVMPPIPGMDANDYVNSGHDLAALLSPLADDWLIPADSFSAQPAPIAWMVKHWIQSNALIMVHGPSGGGKTFIVLDWCLHVAGEIPDWAGQKVHHGPVVYLAGEGHHGLRGRIAAWKQHHSKTKLNMWLSSDGCDLNTPAGYTKAVDHIRMLKNPPKIIVVDTLHRFLAGDENSAQDTKTMLDACGSIMREFNCSVILVHHTGVSEEAQHRARGSSAWRGALDIEISIVPGGNDKPIEIIQRKAKDTEIAPPIYAELRAVIIPGWFDEDKKEVSSAVVVPVGAPKASKKPSKVDSHRKTFENAWWSAGADERNGLPYLSRQAMTDYLVQKMDISEASAKVYIKPSAIGKPIADLLVAEIIEAFEAGWIVVDAAQASAMMIRKSEK